VDGRLVVWFALVARVTRGLVRRLVALVALVALAEGDVGVGRWVYTVTVVVGTGGA